MDYQSVFFQMGRYLKGIIMMDIFVATVLKSIKKEIFTLDILKMELKEVMELITRLQRNKSTKVSLHHIKGFW